MKRIFASSSDPISSRWVVLAALEFFYDAKTVDNYGALPAFGCFATGMRFSRPATCSTLSEEPYRRIRPCSLAIRGGPMTATMGNAALDPFRAVTPATDVDVEFGRFDLGW